MTLFTSDNKLIHPPLSLYST